MASRDNQTMQIFIIVLALLSLCLSVGLFMVNNSRKTAVAQAKNAKESENAARGTANEKAEEARNYKEWIGYAEADSFQTLQTTFEEDMKRWGGTFDESNRSFRTIMENIFEENRKLAQSEGDAKAQVKDFKQKLLAIQTQTEEQIAEYAAKTKAAEQEKESLRNDFDQFRVQIKKDKDKIAAQLAAKREEFDETVAKHNTEQQGLLDKISKLERVIKIYEGKIVPPDPYAQPADGRIVWVNQREAKVWINIGEADHLRPQVTFSVYSGDANDVNSAVSKGSIEVVRLLGSGMAEARITDDVATRPLMEGDKVYSQVWSRGRQIAFAITGLVDLNGDGNDDLQQLKRIIQLNNGKVDAVPDGNGGIDGEMTVDTRYLVLGKYPEDGRASSVATGKSYQKMSAEADTLNIEVIALGDFLNLMGWVSENKAIRLGQDSRSEDFPARRQLDFTPRALKSNPRPFREGGPQPTY